MQHLQEQNLKSNQKGFTLIEIVISLFILSLIAMTAANFMQKINASRTVTAAAERTENQMDQFIHDLKKNLNFVNEDLITSMMLSKCQENNNTPFGKYCSKARFNVATQAGTKIITVEQLCRPLPKNLKPFWEKLSFVENNNPTAFQNVGGFCSCPSNKRPIVRIKSPAGKHKYYPGDHNKLPRVDGIAAFGFCASYLEPSESVVTNREKYEFTTEGVHLKGEHRPQFIRNVFTKPAKSTAVSRVKLIKRSSTHP